MPNPIKVIYENGLLRPLSPIELSEHEQAEIIILSEKEDLSACALARLAQDGHSFDFLAAPEEDVYSPLDGEPV